jgi:hypothetical protein
MHVYCKAHVNKVLFIKDTFVTKLQPKKNNALILQIYIFGIDNKLLSLSGEVFQIPNLLKQIELPIVNRNYCQQEIRKEYGDSFVLVNILFRKNNYHCI